MQKQIEKLLHRSNPVVLLLIKSFPEVHKLIELSKLVQSFR